MPALCVDSTVFAFRKLGQNVDLRHALETQSHTLSIQRHALSDLTHHYAKSVTKAAQPNSEHNFLAVKVLEPT